MSSKHFSDVLSAAVAATGAEVGAAGAEGVGDLAAARFFAASRELPSLASMERPSLIGEASEVGGSASGRSAGPGSGGGEGAEEIAAATTPPAALADATVDFLPR